MKNYVYGRGLPVKDNALTFVTGSDGRFVETAGVSVKDFDVAVHSFESDDNVRKFLSDSVSSRIDTVDSTISDIFDSSAGTFRPTGSELRKMFQDGKIFEFTTENELIYESQSDSAWRSMYEAALLTGNSGWESMNVSDSDSSVDVWNLQNLYLGAFTTRSDFPTVKLLKLPSLSPVNPHSLTTENSEELNTETGESIETKAAQSEDCSKEFRLSIFSFFDNGVKLDFGKSVVIHCEESSDGSSKSYDKISGIYMAKSGENYLKFFSMGDTWHCIPRIVYGYEQIQMSSNAESYRNAPVTTAEYIHTGYHGRNSESDPIKAFNGSGISDGCHDTIVNNMWRSTKQYDAASENGLWLQAEFSDDVCVDAVKIFNFNTSSTEAPYRGVSKLELYGDSAAIAYNQKESMPAACSLDLEEATHNSSYIGQFFELPSSIKTRFFTIHIPGAAIKSGAHFPGLAEVQLFKRKHFHDNRKFSQEKVQTCWESETWKFKCLHCDNEYDSDTKSAWGHERDDLESIAEEEFGTCSQFGHPRLLQCSVCGYYFEASDSDDSHFKNQDYWIKDKSHFEDEFTQILVPCGYDESSVNEDDEDEFDRMVFAFSTKSSEGSMNDEAWATNKYNYTNVHDIESDGEGGRICVWCKLSSEEITSEEADNETIEGDTEDE